MEVVPSGIAKCIPPWPSDCSAGDSASAAAILGRLDVANNWRPLLAVCFARLCLATRKTEKKTKKRKEGKRGRKKRVEENEVEVEKHGCYLRVDGQVLLQRRNAGEHSAQLLPLPNLCLPIHWPLFIFCNDKTMVIRSSKKYKKCAIKEDYLPLLNTDDCLPPRCLRLSAIERFANAAVRSWATSELFAHKETRKRTYKHHALSYTCTSSSSTVTRNDNRANKARCSCRTECMGCTLETCFRRQIYVSLSCCTHYYLKTKVHKNRTFKRTAEARLTSAESQ